MNMNKIKLFLTAVVFFSVSISAQIFGQNDTTEIIILHTNDMHAKIDNMAKLAYYVDYYKANNENVYLFSAGDIFTGNPIVDQYEKPGYPMIDLMNKIGFDLTCVGNHEFDYGQENYNNCQNQANFPFIAANITATKDAVFNVPKAYHKFITKEGVSIGVLGLIHKNKIGIPDCSPLKVIGLSFQNSIESAKAHSSYKDSADIYIALTHLGYKRDIKLVKKVTDFDVLIGGHSHTNLPNGELIGNTLVTQADAYVDYLGVLSLKVVNHKLVSKSDILIDLQNVTNSDEEINELVKQYNNNPSFKKVVGSADDDITGKDELGSLITDGIRDVLNVDIAFQNNGGIRVHEIPKGDITVKQVLEMSPFGNTFVEYDMTPKQIKKLIKYSFAFYNTNELQVSGLQIRLQSTKKGRLKSIELKTIEGKELQNKTYSVAINDYMAASYELKFLKNGKEHSILDSENTIEYIKKLKHVNYKGVKRVIVNSIEN